MPVIGRRNANRINVIALGDLTKIAIRRAAVVFVLIVDSLLRVFATRLVNFGNRDNPAVVSF